MSSLQSAQVVLGVVLAFAGLVLLIAGRRRISRKSGAARGAWSRLGVGCALLGLGYHVAAWALPTSWTPMKVGVDRWWLVAGLAAVAGVGSVFMEARDSRVAL